MSDVQNEIKERLAFIAQHISDFVPKSNKSVLKCSDVKVDDIMQEGADIPLSTLSLINLDKDALLIELQPLFYYISTLNSNVTCLEPPSSEPFIYYIYNKKEVAFTLIFGFDFRNHGTQLLFSRHYCL